MDIGIRLLGKRKIKNKKQRVSGLGDSPCPAPYPANLSQVKFLNTSVNINPQGMNLQELNFQKQIFSLGSILDPHGLIIHVCELYIDMIRESRNTIKVDYIRFKLTTFGIICSRHNHKIQYALSQSRESGY